MSHLLAQKGDDLTKLKGKTGAGAASSAAPKAGGGPGEGNTIKSNLNLAVDIINNCFNLDSPKSV
jgi:hypothetical protein